MKYLDADTDTYTNKNSLKIHVEKNLLLAADQLFCCCFLVTLKRSTENKTKEKTQITVLFEVH